MSVHVSETRIVKGACPQDCPDTCAFLYHVEDGKLVEVTGDPEHPMTRGGLCVKLKDFAEHHYNPNRLLYPMRRSGPKGSGQFQRISWNEALAEIKTRWTDIIAQHGPQAIMPHAYLGHQGTLNGLTCGDAFFNRLGATVAEKTYCEIRIVDRLDHDRRSDRRSRRRKPCLCEVHHRVGNEHDQHEPPCLAVHPEGTEERGQDRRHRPRAHAYGKAGRLAPPDQPRHGCGAGAGDDERDHR